MAEGEEQQTKCKQKQSLYITQERPSGWEKRYYHTCEVSNDKVVYAMKFIRNAVPSFDSNHKFGEGYAIAYSTLKFKHTLQQNRADSSNQKTDCKIVCPRPASPTRRGQTHRRKRRKRRKKFANPKKSCIFAVRIMGRKAHKYRCKILKQNKI